MIFPARSTILSSFMIFLCGWSALTLADSSLFASNLAKGAPIPHAVSADTSLHHYEYVFPDGAIYVYDIDNGHQLVKTIPVPTGSGTRGIAASPSDGMLYISYGGDGGANGNGSLLQYDLHADSVTWTRSYSHGIDSHAITPDGKTIFMPSGELSNDGKWYVLDAADGSETGVITTNGLGSHNTAVSLDGTSVYMGCRDVASVGHDSFYVASTTTYQVTKSVGRALSGIRPFTINGSQTFGFITTTGNLGFQVCNLMTNHIDYTVDLTTMGFFKTTCGTHCETAPSHGISLSPDETKIYVIDSPNSYVHVFDVTGLSHNMPPVKIADIKLAHVLDTYKTNCKYDCQRGGWLQHSLDGRFVYVGDSGDVIDAAADTIVAFLPAMNDSRIMMEIDFRNGIPVATSTRVGMGYMKNIFPPHATSLLLPDSGGTNHSLTVPLRWKAAAFADTYRVQVALDSLFSSIVLDDSTLTDTSAQLTALTDSTVFYWHVSSKNKFGTSPFSAAWNFMAVAAPLPIQLASFAGIASSDARVTLQWSTVSEMNNYGFYIERRRNQSEQFTLVGGLIPGAGTSLDEHQYSWIDSNAAAGTYYYRLKQVDLNGAFTYSSEIKVVVTGVTGVTTRPAMPARYALEANYPNPFNPSTVIQYQLPDNSLVSLRVYNTLGQEVAILANGIHAAGYKSVKFENAQLPSGVYLYRFTAASLSNPGKSFSDVKKMLLIK